MYIEANQSSERFSPLQKPQEVQIQPGLGENSSLVGTGFNLALELTRLFNNYNQNLKEGKEKAWEISVGELEVNIRTFIVEYIQTKTVLPHVNRIAMVNGINRMVGSNGAPVVDAITNQERQGGVKQASVIVDEFISAKIPNRVAVINSPLGHSGILKKDGSEVKYKSNQTMVFWTDQTGELNGLTLVTDLNEEQSKQLSISLGIAEDLLTGQTQYERVSKIVGNPALFSYARGLKNPAEYVLDQIIAIRGEADFNLVQEDGTVEIRSVEQTRRDMQRASSLLSFDEGIEGCINKLKANLLSHPIVQSRVSQLSLRGLRRTSEDVAIFQSQYEIARVIEETILDITVDYLKQNSRHANYTSNKIQYQDAGYSRGSDYDERYMAVAFLKTRSGCAGGGGVSTLSGISLGSAIKGWGGLEGKGGTCDKCPRSADGHYHCPNCNVTFEDESDRSPGEYTPSCGCGYVFACGSKKEESSSSDSKSSIQSEEKKVEKAELPKAA